MSYVKNLRKMLFDVIDEVCNQREKYFVSSKKNFTRKGKFKPQDIFKSLLLMENKSLSHELLPYFDYKNVSSTEKNQSSRHKKSSCILGAEKTDGFLGKKE